jgi:hypothetical protein
MKARLSSFAFLLLAALLILLPPSGRASSRPDDPWWMAWYRIKLTLNNNMSGRALAATPRLVYRTCNFCWMAQPNGEDVASSIPRMKFAHQIVAWKR